MKKYFKYAGIVSVVLAVVAFILVVACNGAKFEAGGYTDKTKGMDMIFAKGDCKGADKSVAGLFGFIFLLVAMIAAIVGVLLPLVGKEMNPKIASIINIVAAVLFILGGILIICTAHSFIDANDDGMTKAMIKEAKKHTDCTVEYALAGILSMLAGVVTLVPAVSGFMNKD